MVVAMVGVMGAGHMRLGTAGGLSLRGSQWYGWESALCKRTDALSPPGQPTHVTGVEQSSGWWTGHAEACVVRTSLASTLSQHAIRDARRGAPRVRACGKRPERPSARDESGLGGCRDGLRVCELPHQYMLRQVLAVQLGTVRIRGDEKRINDGFDNSSRVKVPICSSVLRVSWLLALRRSPAPLLIIFTDTPMARCFSLRKMHR